MAIFRAGQFNAGMECSGVHIQGPLQFHRGSINTINSSEAGSMLGVEDMVSWQLDGVLGLSVALVGRPESLSWHLSLGGL